MEVTVDLQRSDIEMAVFTACYQKGDPKAANLEKTVAQCVSLLWKKTRRSAKQEAGEQVTPKRVIKARG